MIGRPWRTAAQAYKEKGDTGRVDVIINSYRTAPDHRGRGFAADSRRASARAPSQDQLGPAWRRLAGTDE